MKVRSTLILIVCLVLITAAVPILSASAQSMTAPPSPIASSHKPSVLVAHASDGSLDTSFDPGTGTNANVSAIALQPDGKIVVGGSFTEYNGTARSRIARVNADGSLDTSFDPGTGTNLGSAVYAIAVQSNGKIVIGGGFASYGSVDRQNIARVNANGSLDTSFDPGDGFDSQVLAIALQPDGKILVGGSFTHFDNVSRPYVARLNSDGSLDTTFDPGLGADDRVHSIALQPDGKVLIGGYFNEVGGQVRHHLARLLAGGSLDTAFDPGLVQNNYAIVYSIIVQPGGKLLVGGSFDHYDGEEVYGIAQANADGSIDQTFDPGVGTNNSVLAIALQPNGRVLVAGGFDQYNWITREHIARANANGSLDASFDPGDGTDLLIDAMILQPDGKILIGGGFATYDNVSRNGIARVNGYGRAFYVYVPMVLRNY